MIILRILLKSKAIQFCAIAASLAVLLISVGIEYGLSKSDWSSWVQAFGSIGAIVAAFLVADRQFVKAREIDARRASEEIIRKAHIIHAILLNVSAAAYQIQKADSENDMNFLHTFDAAIFTNQATLLQGIPPLDTPSAGIIYAIVDLPQKISSLATCISSGQAGGGGNPEMSMYVIQSYNVKGKALAVLRVANEAQIQCRELVPGLS